MLDDSGFVIEQRYSQWQKKKVRTIIVNAHSKSITQKSISSALNIAKPYDRIELTGGEYQEALTITFPLELVASEGEDPVIVSRNSGVTVTAEIEVYLENLHIISKGVTKLDAAVVTMAGSVVIFRCKLNSLLIGGTSKPHVENCVVTDSASGYGITVQDFGGGSIQSTTVHGHRLSCVDIDTRGELKVTECTLYNYLSSEGDVVTVSGAVSSIARDVPGQTSYLSCSHVEVSKCQIFITDQEGPRRRSIGSVGHLQPYGAQCCVTMANGAAPTFSNNELVEGEIGFLFDNVGAAQLRGNVIRCQRRCGALAFVEDAVSYSKDRANLCITGDNVFDRCAIGIDVQCSFMRNLIAQLRGNGDTILCNELPNPKRTFRWSQVLTPGVSKTVSPLDGDYHTMMYGEYVSTNQIKQRMHDLAVAVLEAYPTCLSPAFAVASASAMVASLATSQQKLVPGSLSNVFAELFNATLEVKVDLQNRNKDSAEYMSRVRGNQGIDIINTKFSNCGACAVRFGRQGYGLVQDCIFEDCGTHAVVVDCGAHPLITGCRFLRSRKAALVVANFANPLIIGNEIANGQMVGVALTNLSRGLLVGNMIFGNQGAGIHVEQNSQPVICGNAIVQNRSCGTSVESFSQPHVVFNHFSGNGAVHLQCSGSSDAFVAYNYMQSSPDTGVRVDSLSRCTFVKNHISLNGDGMLVELDADPVVQDNVFEKNMKSGIVVQNNGLGTFLRNRIAENSGPNVLVKDGGSPSFRANKIEKGYQGGIVAIREGAGLFELNHISENSVANVLLADSYTAPTFISNSLFKSSSGCGVVAARGATGTFERNHIYENKQGGVYLLTKANPRFFKNDIAREALGVIVSAAGKGDFEANTIDNCYGTGVLVQREGDPVFKGNQISGCKMSGLHVTPDGIGQFTENKIFENDIGVQLGSTMESAEVDLHSIYIEDHSDPASPLGAASLDRPSTSQRNPPARGRKSILANLASAASARRASCMRPPTGRITSNEIHHNENGGVLLERNVNMEMEANLIYDNKKYGVRGDTSYTARRAKRVMEEKFSVMDVAIATDDKTASANCSALLRNNKIYSHQKANVYMIDFDVTQDVRMEENDIYGAPMGIYVGNNSSLPFAERNRIHHCYDGVFADTGGRGEFSENTIEYCQYVGIFISSNANPQFVDGNTVQFCGVCGVLVDAGGRGLLQKGIIRHCTLGVITFSGAAAASSVSREEIIKANIVSSAARFVENTIEENECHGVLICSVISGAPLRTPLAQQKAEVLNNKEHFPAVPYTGVSQLKADEALATLFLKNTIRRNRLCGVYHDRFEHWNLRDLSGNVGGALSPNNQSDDALKASAVKNAYGGYEILLGTSIVLNSESHLQERQEKQVSFVENTITECSIGFSAGYGCHPFLLRNIITKNTFIGLLLRFGSAVSTYGCEISENGLAGVYASKGAKGQVTRGHIKANNTLCRVKNSPHDARDFTKAVFCERFETIGKSDPSIVVNAETFERGTQRSYEQMHYLVDVHMYAFSNAVRMLAELTSASSAGNGMASGCAPSTLVSGGRRTSDLGGIGIEEYLQVCVADGGLGVWVEEGSRVSVRSNSIEKNQHVGVFVSKGIQEHHKVLYGSYRMDVVPMREKGKRNIMTGGEDLEAPPLATADPAAVFTPATLCATGAVAARQVAQNMEVTMSFSMLQVSLSISDAEAKAPTERAERQDSIHHALIAENQIIENQFGVFIELFEELQTNSKKIQLQDGGEAATASSNEDGAACTLSKQDLRVLDWTHNSSNLDFSIVVEKNSITANKNCGVYCQHVVQVHASPVVPSRSAIQDKVAAQYEHFQADLVMGRTIAYPTSHAFTLVPMAGKVANAHIRQNEIYANLGLQGFVTSRYVVNSADHHKTLLQFDTMASPQGSNFCSKVLFAIPFYAALVQLPPPGLVLWEENTIRDGYNGIQLCGYLSAQCTRFEKNTFGNISGDALALQGHMASASIGNGNRFEHNLIAINIKTVITAHALCYSNPDFRTRVFRNTFRSAKDVGILTDCAGVNTLVCRNEFADFDKGTAALFLSSATTTVVLTNVFHNSFSPVVVVRGPQPSSEETRSNALLVENYFYGNYIGALVCNGAAPRFERNLFKGNLRSGLEIQGRQTSPVVSKCVFKQHKRDPNADAQDVALKKSTNGLRGLQLRYPADGKVHFRNSTVVVNLTPENEHVLDLSSTVSLPAGMLIGPEAQGLVEECVFRENDVGIDSVRDAMTEKELASGEANATTSTTTTTSNSKVLKVNTAPLASHTGTARVQACVFHKNLVAGVLARGTPNDSETAPSSPISLAASLRRTGTTNNASFLAQFAEVAVAGTGAEKPLETVLFEKCYFIENVNDASTGDAITIDRGYTVFRNNLFTGTVHGLFNGLSLFEENFFFPLQESPKLNPIALELHEGSKLRFERNTILNRRFGIQTLHNCGGRILQNRIVGCINGISVAPFSSAAFVQNYVWQSEDCAIVAYGGVLTDNEVFEAPTGIIVQSPSVYKTINAIPQNMRNGLDLNVCQNIVSFCTSDGFLVTCPGKFEGNHVNKCKIGFNVVCPETTDANKAAIIKNNFAYDNGIGVFLDNKSMSTVEDNDIFDNDEVGLVVSQSAGGVLQNNRISSAREQGAIEVPSETRVKSLSNTIRNQFSPSFNRGVRNSRNKEYETKAQSIHRDINQLTNMLSTMQEQDVALSNSLFALVSQLEEVHGKSVVSAGTSAATTTLAGSPSRALLRLSVPNLGQVGDADNGHLVPSSTKSLRSQSARKKSTTHSSFAAAARKKVKPGSAGDHTQRPVLVHVLTTATVPAKAAALGNSVVKVLALSPMSKMNFLTTVSTSPSQLTTYLEHTTPSLCFLVVDRSMGELRHLDAAALQALHTKFASTATAASDFRLCYVVVPKGSAQLKATVGAESMTLAEFASDRTVFTYDSSVDAIINDMQKKIAADIQASTDSASPKSRSSIAAASPSDESPLLPTTPEKSTKHYVTTPPLSREKVGNLLALITPEALGYKTKESAPKKRKASITSTTRVSSGGPRRASRMPSAKRRKNSAKSGLVTIKSSDPTSPEGDDSKNNNSSAASTSTTTPKKTKRRKSSVVVKAPKKES